MKKLLIIGLIGGLGLITLDCLQKDNASSTIRQEVMEIKTYAAIGLRQPGYESTGKQPPPIKDIFDPYLAHKQSRVIIDKYGTQAVPYLLEILFDDKVPLNARIEVLAMLVRLKHKESLVKAYHKYKNRKGSHPLSGHIIYALYELKEEKGDIFYEAFNDSNPGVKTLAGLILWERGEKTKALVTELIKAYESAKEGLIASLIYLSIYDVIMPFPFKHHGNFYKWWEENKQFFYLSDSGRFEMNNWAKEFNLLVDEKTGRAIDPKDGHILTEQELIQMKRDKLKEQMNKDKPK